MDQPKLERLLRLMKLLTANSYLTVENIAEKLGITTRSVYRFFPLSRIRDQEEEWMHPTR